VYLIYSLLLTLGFLLLLPRFAIDAFRSGKYITGIGERLGKIPTVDPSAGRVIWLHCVSVGETEAARPLVRAIRERLPTHQLVISTTTVTGQQVARQAFNQQAAAIFYFPIDWSWTVRRVLRALSPAAVLIMETELWPNLLRECRRRSVPVALINGRISPKSYRRYQKIRSFMPRVLAGLAAALMQSDEDATRIAKLGLPEDRIRTLGNLKFDSASLPANLSSLTFDLRQRFDIHASRPLIVAASTHAPEESVVVDAFKAIRETPPGKESRLLIAPRHPERFDEVAKLINDSGFSWSRRSSPPAPRDATSEIILLDSIGELRSTFQLAEIAFIGGSIIPHGGQNVLEPAAQGVCVITGAYTENFAAIIRALMAADALIQLPPVSVAEAPASLAHALDELLANETRRKAMGARAQNVCAGSRGATERAVEFIGDLVAPRVATGEGVSIPAVSLTAAK
jgi:3-deoxy-D-manno-octulosonic-acid transferase